MNDDKLKDIALNFQAGINNELLRENEKLKQKIEALQKEPCEDRKNCPLRHENGNCLSVGGFCLAVDNKHCQLKKEPCENTDVPTTDAISRQAAIDAVRGSVWAQNHIKNLPSVQPHIIKCKDCKHFKGKVVCEYHAGFFFPDPEFFCADAEAKMEEGDK